MSKPKDVIVKMQRPIYTNGSTNEILSYLVDDNLEQISNDLIAPMDSDLIDELFGTNHKVYYLGSHVEGQLVNLAYPLIPMHKDEWN